MAQARYVLAVDIGGTFTDIVLQGDDGSGGRLKISSTPPDFEQAILQGLDELFDPDLGREGVTRLAHGTTVATNALLERRGARTALVTTKGFRDVLEIARMRRPALFDTGFEKPHPLAPRNLRFEIDERMNAQGEVVRRPRSGDIDTLAEELVASRVESVAVCFLHSYRNPVNEETVAGRLRHLLASVHITASNELLPELKEYERTSTTVVNSYIQPTVGQYLESLEKGLASLGFDCEVQVMQSNGSLFGSRTARAQPVRLIESGPAAGVIAARSLADDLGEPNVIAFDMGGTTAKASLIENGQAFEAAEHEVGGGMNQSRLFIQGGGFTVRIPSLDIAEVGAGGGSIFWIDQGGAPHVGPQSAGAIPGPVCYGAGGTKVTVTDANLVLGYLNPHSIAGGSRRLDRSAAEWGLDTQVAGPLGMSRLEAAYGVHRLANTNMSQAIRGVSIERGRDPRNFMLIAFGGAGPMHAALIARHFEVERVVVPASPGLFCAIGLQVADLRHDYVVSYELPNDPDGGTVSQLFDQLEDRARRFVIDSGLPVADLSLERFVDQRYRGQAHELSVPVPGRRVLSQTDLHNAGQDFHLAHELTYGHSTPDEPVQLISVRLRATVRTPKAGNIFAMQPDGDRTTDGSRLAFFGKRDGVLATPVVSRRSVPVEEVGGPMIVEDMDATTVVPPRFTVRRDQMGNLVIRSRR
ncbi:MAG: hydantoinase/oxoprolinase family protein [bacterium]|nr:hydantoinase/oxoprolinase family protein [bacterium]